MPESLSLNRNNKPCSHFCTWHSKSIDYAFCIDIILLAVRLFTISIWSYFLLHAANPSIFFQLCFVSIIFFSDAIDGIISRRFSTPSHQFLFRILDTFIDKIGILAFLITLLFLGSIQLSVFFIIIGYNVLLVIPPIVKFLYGNDRHLKWIQATFWSRFYAFSVGIFCFMAANFNLSFFAGEICSYFLFLALFSFISHIIKIRNI